jgi:hypothetical protein
VNLSVADLPQFHAVRALPAIGNNSDDGAPALNKKP